jgi:hypothetical protein
LLGSLRIVVLVEVVLIVEIRVDRILVVVLSLTRLLLDLVVLLLLDVLSAVFGSVNRRKMEKSKETAGAPSPASPPPRASTARILWPLVPSSDRC